MSLIEKVLKKGFRVTLFSWSFGGKKQTTAQRAYDVYRKRKAYEQEIWAAEGCQGVPGGVEGEAASAPQGESDGS